MVRTLYWAMYWAMYRGLYWALLVVCLWLGGVASSWADSPRPVLRMATGEWPPYVSQKLPNHGGVVELVNAVVEEMGMTLQYDFVPWPRAEALVKSGDVYAAFPYARTEAREAEFDFSAPLFASYSVFFYFKPHLHSADFQTLADLKRFRIAGVNGFFYLDLLDQAGLQVTRLSQRRQLVLWLYRDRVDLIPMDLISGQALINDMFPEDAHHFTYIPKSIDEEQGIVQNHLLVSRKFNTANDLTVRFNQALQRLKADGRYQAIMDANQLYQLPSAQ